MAEQVFLVVAITLSVPWWLPQLVKVWRHGGAGVSQASWVLSVLSLTLWGAWAWQAGQPVVAVAEWIPAAGCALVVSRLGLSRRAGLVVAVAAVVVACLGVLAQTRPVLATALALGGTVAIRVPQIAALARSRKPHRVSALSWAMKASSNVAWLGWGLTAGQPTMVAGATLSIVLSGAVVALALARGRAAKDAVDAPAAP